MKSRRQDADTNYYVDRYETKYFALICAALLMCVLDAYLTLRILHFGGSEINPLMVVLIDRKPALAMIAKYLGMAVGIAVILIHKNFIVFSRLKVRYFLYLIFIVYGLLVSYEAYVVLTYVKMAGPLS